MMLMVSTQCIWHFGNNQLLLFQLYTSKIHFLQELIKSVQSILNEMSPYNMTSITKRFKALPIDNLYCLEKTVDLVFEKVIYI